MNAYKRKIIIWTFLTLLAYIGVIGLSVLIANVNSIIALFDKVDFSSILTNDYRVVQSYAIGGLAFSCLVSLVGTIIVYSGWKSMKYTEMFY